MRTVSVYLSIVTLHVSQSPAGGFVLLCTITTITHPISIHSAPSLSEDIVVIVVQYPLKTPTRHGRTQVSTERLIEAVVLMQPLSGGGEVRAESVVHSGKQGSGDQSPVTSPVSSQTRLEANNRNTSKCILGTEHSIKSPC